MLIKCISYRRRSSSVYRRNLVNTKACVLVLAFAAMAALSPAGSGAPRGGLGQKNIKDDSSTDPGRDALRQIVQNQCVVNWTQHQNPAPCERVFLADEKTDASGYAILADRKGAAHYLLIPTQTMRGVEGDELLDPDLPNYFAEAWRARDVITKFVGHPVLRTAVGLAVNNAHSRTQDQFHIHIDCLRQDVVDSLRAAAEHVGPAWGPINVVGSTYQAMRIEAVSLDGSSPFDLVSQLGPEVRHHLGDYTVVVAGMQYKSGAGFMLLTGTGPTGELLLDSACAVAGAGG
jgi:CDP-diacylglycerol pyrophosphatase